MMARSPRTKQLGRGLITCCLPPGHVRVGSASKLLIVGIAIAIAKSSASAESVYDQRTGLGVTAPPEYSVKASPPRGRYTAVIDLKRQGARDTGCKVGFQPAAPAQARLTQAEINELVSGPERRAVLQSVFGLLYEIVGLEPLEHGGVQGSAAIATLKPLPTMPARATEMMNMFYLLETPAGRTTLVCLSERKDFAAHKLEFERILKSVVLPR